MLRPTIAGIILLSLWALSSHYLRPPAEPAPAIAKPPVKSPKPKVQAQDVGLKSPFAESLSRLPTVYAPGEENVKRKESLKESGEILGKVSQMLEAEPELAQEGLKFYLACAKREGLVPSVRAVCLRTYIDMVEKMPKPPTVDLTQFSAELLRAVYYLRES